MPRISNIEMLQQTEQHVMMIRTRTNLNNLGNVFTESFGKIGAYLKELGVLMTDIPFVAYPDYENMDEQNIEVIIGFPIAKPLSEKDNIKYSLVPESKIIFCMYRGDYNEIAPVYGEMTEWIRNNGYEGSGASIEYYYNSIEYPQSDYLTKVVMPLK